MIIRRQIGPGEAYAPAVLAPDGHLVAVSGTVAFDGDGQVVGVGSVARQTEFIFERIGALLAEEGGSLADVIKITAYLTDRATYGDYAAERSKAFAGLPKPASATVGVAFLVDDRLLVEVEALAVIPGGDDQ